MFCKTCGTMLAPKKTLYGKWMSCPNGHTQPELVQAVPELKEKNLKVGTELKVHDGTNLLAVHTHQCQKCGYDQAELIEMSCSYTDEDNFYWMKCGRCGHVERLEGKVK